MAVNLSKVRDPRFWYKWIAVNAVGDMISAELRGFLNLHKQMKESDLYGIYILDDGRYYIPNGIRALKAGYFITPSGYLYKVLGIKKDVSPTYFTFELVKKYSPKDLVKGIAETNAEVARRV